MKLYYRIIFLFLFLGYFTPLLSQSSQLNLEKYWYYRYRFLGDGTEDFPGFIRIGNQAGHSIPMAVRDEHKINNHWTINDCDSIKDRDTLKGYLKWADGTIDMGFYLSMLATEWALLSAYNQNKEQTGKELYYALKTINRLDRKAELLYGMSKDKNGFFIRDDVPANFHQHFPGFDMALSDWTCYNSGANCPTNPPPTLKVGAAMSQDQVISLLMGFRLIKAFIPASTNYNGESLLNLTERITKRITNYVKKTPVANEWVIFDPNGDPVCRGPVALWFSNPMATIASQITGTNMHNFHSSTGVGFSAWSLIETGLLKQPYHSVTVCAAIIPPPFGPLYCDTLEVTATNMSMILQLASTSNRFSNKFAFDLQTDISGMEIYGLLNSVLYSRPLFVPMDSIHKFLDTAPCAGPCLDDGANHNFGDYTNSDCTPVNGWEATNRWRHMHDDEIDDGAGAWGDNPGLDYMLLYNLFHLYQLQQGNSITAYNNLLDRKITNNFPLIPTSLGSKSNPITINAFRSITYNGEVAQNGDVTLRAGKCIDLLDGLDQDVGANFEAFVEPFECQNGQYRSSSSYLGNMLSPYDTAHATEPDLYTADLSENNYNAIAEEQDTVQEDTQQQETTNKEKQKKYALQVIPNPVKHHTTISYRLPRQTTVQLTINNMMGENVKTLHKNKLQAAGRHQWQFEESGLSPGVYVVLLRTGELQLTQKMVVLQ